MKVGVSRYVIALLILPLLAGLPRPACSFSMAQVKQVQDKANECMNRLRTALEDGKDVSAIIPMMKQVKVLGDAGRISEANELLDRILLRFEQLYRPLAENHASAAQLFGNPRRVDIIGLEFGAMEPFISRDGRVLFFNSDEKDTPVSGKDIYYARRVDDLTFRFMGQVQGVNSDVVDGVPTMDRKGNFYFVSVRNYDRRHDFTTVYKGRFRNGQVTDIVPVPELSLKIPGWLNMDIEISADGETLYATQTYFGNGAPPTKSYFIYADLIHGKFHVNENSDTIFKNINTGDLEYAASISSNGLEIFFTRASNLQSVPGFLSYRAVRPGLHEPFGEPEPINAIAGIAEAPAISGDGKRLYYHKKVKGRFYIYTVERLQP